MKLVTQMIKANFQPLFLRFFTELLLPVFKQYFFLRFELVGGESFRKSFICSHLILILGSRVLEMTEKDPQFHSNLQVETPLEGISP